MCILDVVHRIVVRSTFCELEIEVEVLVIGTADEEKAGRIVADLATRTMPNLDLAPYRSVRF